MKIQGALLVEKGSPYPRRHLLELPYRQILLGRQFQEHHPDFPFTDPHISRRHAIISWEQGLFLITDLSSKHGTSLNNLHIQPGKSYNLHDGDLISLAKGVVSLKFLCSNLDGVTTELISPHDLSDQNMFDPIVINTQRREVIVRGNHIYLQGKEMDLLIALYENKAQAVGYDEIRKSVWPERPEGVTPGVPDVDTSEITTLVYRLRQKLGASSSLITTVSRYGYRLDL